MFDLAQINASQNNQAATERYYLLAYSAYENARIHALGEQGRAQLDTQYMDEIDDYIQLKINQGQLTQALLLLESNKARTLNDIIVQPNYKELYQRLLTLRQKHAAKRLALLNREDLESQSGIDAVLADLETLYATQQTEAQQLRTASQLAHLATSDTYSIHQLAALREQLPNHLAILAFFSGTHQAGVFVLTQDQLHWIAFADAPAAYQRAIRQLQLALSNADTDYYLEPARYLQRQLLAPVLALLPTQITTIVSSPDKFFNQLPLGALLDERGYLAQQYAFIRIPSLRYAQNPATLERAAVFSGISCTDPNIEGARLPFQADTAKRLTQLFNDKHHGYAGQACNVTNLSNAIAQLSELSFLHIGAHGQFYSQSPMESAIYLSSEADQQSASIWDVQTIAATNLSNIDLITLSSCETGVVSPSKGRDVFGMIRGFYFAQANQVIAPLWSVHDRATSEFMQAFYTAYRRGHSALVSLQHAKTTLLQNPRYTHPFYWAGFVLFGADA